MAVTKASAAQPAHSLAQNFIHVIPSDWSTLHRPPTHSYLSCPTPGTGDLLPRKLADSSSGSELRFVSTGSGHPWWRLHQALTTLCCPSGSGGWWEEGQSGRRRKEERKASVCGRALTRHIRPRQARGRSQQPG